MRSQLFDSQLIENRRQFFGRTSTGIGVAALASLLAAAYGKGRDL